MRKPTEIDFNMTQQMKNRRRNDIPKNLPVCQAMSQKATLDEVGINKGFCVLLIKQHINCAAANAFCVYWGEKKYFKQMIRLT